MKKVKNYFEEKNLELRKYELGKCTPSKTPAEILDKMTRTVH